MRLGLSGHFLALTGKHPVSGTADLGATILLYWILKRCIIEELENPYNCSLETSRRASFAPPFVSVERQGQSRSPKLLVAYVDRKGPCEELSPGWHPFMPNTLLHGQYCSQLGMSLQGLPRQPEIHGPASGTSVL